MMELYSVVTCNSGLTGCGIIMEIMDTSLTRSGYYLDSDYLYTLVTDFGNAAVLTEYELNNNYEFLYVEEDPKGRLDKQLRNLEIVKQQYFGGGEGDGL